MSTIQETKKSARSIAEEIERFRYGWRDVPVTKPDGSIELERIPLTLEDVLHPEEGDTHLPSHGHTLDCNYLLDVQSARLASDPTAVVLSDVDVFWERPEWKHHRPDIAVILGVRSQKNWRSFRVAEEGTRPALIIEVVSRETRVNDVETKVEEYARVGVPHYVVADLRESDDRRSLSLIDYRLGPAGDYERQPLDEQNRVWLEEPIGLWLGIVESTEFAGDRLAPFDPVTGEEIGDYQKLWRELAAKEAALADKEAALAAKDQALAGKDEALAANRVALAAKDEALAAERARVIELEAKLQRLLGNGAAT